MITLLTVLLACTDASTGHGHSHGSDGSHAEPDEAGVSVAVTRWTDSHELFAELGAPVAGRALAYHAHVTRLADNHAATSGMLTFRFEQDGFAIESHTDPAVARPGIFAAEAVAPQEAGSYRLVFSYTDGDEHATWDAGEVLVGGSGPGTRAEEAEGEIAFLKESQWQIPFRVEPAAHYPLAPVVTAAGTVEPAPGETAVVAAPVEGLVAWSDSLPVVGRAVTRGDRLATLIPAGAAEHWASLQAELSTARIDRNLAANDLERVSGLAEQELLPERRLLEAQATLDRAAADLSAAQRRVSALTSGSAGAVPIRAPSDGVIVEVGASHGEPVSAGSPLVKVSAGDGVLIRGHAHDRLHTTLTPIASLSVMRGGWEAPRDLLASGGRLLTERLIVDPNTLSAPVVALAGADVGLVPGDLIELQIGVGQPEPVLAVPRSAVVEINGQDVVFVQISGESFSRRRVELGDGDASHVAIRSGLSAGEMVVTEGGFDVHVASLSGALESHRH